VSKSGVCMSYNSSLKRIVKMGRNGAWFRSGGTLDKEPDGPAKGEPGRDSKSAPLWLPNTCPSVLGNGQLQSRSSRRTGSPSSILFHWRDALLARGADCSPMTWASCLMQNTSFEQVRGVFFTANRWRIAVSQH